MVHTDDDVHGIAPQPGANPASAEPSVTGPADPTYISDIIGLTPLQQRTLALLFDQRNTFADVARELGIHRNILLRRRSCHPGFIAAYNRKRQEIADDHTHALADLLDDAIETIQAHLRRKRRKPDEHQTRSALRLIGALGRTRRLSASGPQTPMSFSMT